jgi:DNA-binding MarR family transcriptional regulator
MDRTTLTAALKPLARRGLVVIEAGTADRRNRRLRLTPAGRDVLAAAVPIWRQIQAEIEAELAGQDVAALRAALQALGHDGAARVVDSAATARR